MLVPDTELKRRVSNFQDVLRREGIEGALLVQRADTFYFSGTAQNVHVYIPREGRPVVMAYRDFARAQAESPWGVIPLSGLSKIPPLIQGADLPLPKTLGLEFDVLPVSQFERYRKAFPEAAMVDVSYLIRLQRAVKSDWEIARIEENGQIYTAVLDYAREILRPGLMEVELEGFLEAKARTLGHEGFVRVRGFGSEFHFGSVFAGKRSAVAGYFDGPLVGLGDSIAHPQGASRAAIEEGETVIIDLVMAAHGYQIDETRVAVIGSMAPELEAAYETALEVEERIRKAMVPGSNAGEIYQEIIAWVRENTSYEQNFMGYGQSRVSFVGHGIGLELDELPTISRGAKEVLVPGMVVAIEPKFVFPGIGAIGIEDTVVVSGEEGARYLCNAPQTINKL